MLALIMAGGSGTRLWPVSRKNKPKQLLSLISKQTLLQVTYRRLKARFSPQEIFLATTAEHFTHVKKQLPGVPRRNFSIEPKLKDRGPAIALAALIMEQRHPGSVFVAVWSDHYIKNTKAYFSALRQAEKIIQRDPKTFVCIGVKPTSPHTGFGYIQKGKALKAGPDLLGFKVKNFHEKPDLKTANKFLKTGNHLWNTGYFVCRTDTLLELYKKYLPKVYQQLLKIFPFVGKAGQQKAVDRFYPQMPEVDIEKGLVEKLKNLSVVQAEFDWTDVGSWQVIKDLFSKQGQNLCLGAVTTLNSSGNLIYNYENKLVATVGLKNLIVVNTKNSLLIADKQSSEQVKLLVKKLGRQKNLKKFL